MTPSPLRVAAVVIGAVAAAADDDYGGDDVVAVVAVAIADGGVVGVVVASGASCWAGVRRHRHEFDCWWDSKLGHLCLQILHLRSQLPMLASWVGCDLFALRRRLKSM